MRSPDSVAPVCLTGSYIDLCGEGMPVARCQVSFRMV